MTRTVGSGNDISIHSLRMEGDIKETPKTSMKSFQSTPSAWRETLGEEAYDKLHEISIHSLRMEGDQYNTRSSDHGRLFQSTPSAWRETASATAKNFDFIFQSTPSAWRETEVGDPILEEFVFQSTPSAWRETSTVVLPAPRSAISIHSLRMEGD